MKKEKYKAITVVVAKVDGGRVGGHRPWEWCVIVQECYTYPLWQFWRTNESLCHIFGAFPSRNKAEQFAKYLTHPK